MRNDVRDMSFFAKVRFSSCKTFAVFEIIMNSCGNVDNWVIRLTLFYDFKVKELNFPIHRE